MVVSVLFFSVLRERVGKAATTVQLPEGATGATLLDALEWAYPQFSAFRPVVRLAVNETYESESAALADGDEIALITPVSGG